MLDLILDLSDNGDLGWELVELGLGHGDSVRSWLEGTVRVDLRVEGSRRHAQAGLAVDVFCGPHEVLRPAHLQRQGGELGGGGKGWGWIGLVCGGGRYLKCTHAREVYM